MLGATLVAIGATLGVTLGRSLMGRVKVRRRAARPWPRLFLRGAPILLGALAFGAMLATQPHLRTTYTPGQFAAASDIDSQRGFYASETDAAGNRYVWTQERATLVLNFLTRKPVTVTFTIRSAAVAGGPDTPVPVVINGQGVGELRPDPANPAFQAIAIRLVPPAWGGRQTEIKLLPAPFRPQGESRTLGTMIQRISVDKSEAWSTVSRRMWLVWLMPVIAVLALGCAYATRRSRSPWVAYGPVALFLAGMICGVALLVLVIRVGVVEDDTYLAWTLGSACTAICFGVGAATAPVRSLDGRNLLQVMHARIGSYRLIPRIRTMMRGTMRPAPVEVSPTRAVIMRDLLAVFLVALGIRLIWAVVVPPWQAPDEPDHFIYVAHIAEQKEIPHPPYPNYPFYPQEDLRSWQLTLLGRISSLGASLNRELPYLPISYDYDAARGFQAPGADRRSDSGARATPYPPLYYLYGALPYWLFKGAPIVARLFAVRCGSAVLGALSCVFGYLMAYELRRTRRWGGALGFCMALLPMYAFATATVNNDAAMNLCAAAVIWLAVRAYRQTGPPLRLALALGVASGLALLTKPTVAPVVAVAGGIVLVKLLSALRSAFPVVKEKLLACGAYAAGAGAAYGPWLLFRLHYYGNIGFGTLPHIPLLHFLTGSAPVAAASPPSAAAIAGSSSPPQFSVAAISLWRYLHIMKDKGWIYFHNLLIKGVWGNFGWLDAPLPDRAFVPIVVVYIIGGIGILIQLALQAERRGALFLLIGFLVAQALFLFIGADYSQGYARLGVEIGLQGRYFFPILAPLLFLLLSGWDHLCRENALAPRLAPLGMAVLQLTALATVLFRYYGVKIG